MFTQTPLPVSYEAYVYGAFTEIGIYRQTAIYRIVICIGNCRQDTQGIYIRRVSSQGGADAVGGSATDRRLHLRPAPGGGEKSPQLPCAPTSVLGGGAGRDALICAP